MQQITKIFLFSILINLPIGNQAIAENTSETDFVRPKLNPVMPQTENWADLQNYDPDLTGDLFDSIKYIPLSDNDEVWLSIGGQIRSRIETWENFGANKSNDDTFVLNRLLLHGDLHMTEHVRFFIQGIAAFSEDRELPGGNRTLDVNQGDLQQTFLEFLIPLEDVSNLSIKIGRQHLLFGSQRLVSPLPWANTQRKWDGISAKLDTETLDITGFYTHFVPVQRYTFDQEEDIQFWGLFAEDTYKGSDAKWNIYYYGLNRKGTAFNGTTGQEERHTLGIRLFGNVSDTTFDYDMETAYQFGRVGSGDISAYMFTSELGYKFDFKSYTPRIAIGLDIASGDDKPGGNVETFNQLFPLGHKYFGFIDLIGRQNIIDLYQSVSIPITPKLKASFANHMFWRANENDALYNAGGGIVRAASPDASKRVGSEADLVLKYTIDHHASVTAGYSHFFAGDFFEDTGTSDDIDFFYLQYAFNF
ncbi:alginate export family protein [Planctomycetota bacterium]|nr:alginate export family protein [Planctomycetota bacterium]